VERLFGLGCAVVPERVAECVPDAGEPFLVGVAVLDDEEVDGLRAAEREPEADGGSVVLHEQAVAGQSEVVDERLDRAGEVIEGVRPLVGVGRFAVPEARVVRRDQVEPVGERHHQVAVHERRRGESVKEQKGRAGRVTGFAIGDLHAGDGGGSVLNGHGCSPFE
jgi:hypothetical protein